MIEGFLSLFPLELQRHPHVAVVAVALIAGLLRGGSVSRVGLCGLALVFFHFVAKVLLLQMGNTGCSGCMIWSIQTYMTITGTILPLALAAGWSLVAYALVVPRRVGPNNSFKGMPLRGTP